MAIQIEYQPQPIYMNRFNPRNILLKNKIPCDDVEWVEKFYDQDKQKDGDIYHPRPEAPDSWMTIHRDPAKYIVLFCGRRAGKTVGGIHDLVFMRAMQCPRKVVKSFQGQLLCPYIAPHKTEAKQIIWERLKTVAAPVTDKHTTPNNTELTIKLVNGMWLRLLGADKDPDKLRGVPFWSAIFDEAGDMDETVFSKHLQPSFTDAALVNAGGGRAMFTGTPYGTNWFYKNFLLGLSDRTGRWSSYRYASFQAHYRNQLEEALTYYDYKKKQDLATWRREYYASEAGHTGRIYKAFNKIIHVRDFEIQPEWNICVGIDNGCEDPTAILVGGIDHIGRVWIRHEYVSNHGLISEHAAALKKMLKPYRINMAVTGGEPDVFVMDQTNKQLFYEWGEHGIYPSKAGNVRDTVIPGIRRVQEMLAIDDLYGMPWLFIHPSCKITVEQMEKYRWKKRTRNSGTAGLDENERLDGYETPLKVDDHTCDVIRYICMAKPNPAQQKRPNVNPTMQERLQEHYRHLSSMKILKRSDTDPLTGGLT